jgi:hypothetical protein
MPAVRTILNIGPVRLGFFGFAFLVLSVAVPLIIFRELDLEQVLAVRRIASVPSATFCVLLLLVYFASDGLRLHHTLRTLGHALPGRKMAKLVFINILFSNLTPMATGGGLAQVWYLRRHGVHYGTAAAATTMRTVLAMLLIFIPAPFAFAIIDPVSERFSADWLPALLGGTAVVYLSSFGLILARPMWIVGVVASLLRALNAVRIVSTERSRRWLSGLRRETIRFSRGMRAYLTGPRTHILLSVIYTVIFLLALFSFPALILFGLGYDVDFWTTIGMMTIATFVAYLAPTPGAAGVAEGSFALLFSTRLDAPDLVLAVVIWRFLTIYLGMIVGITVILHELWPVRRRRA